MEDRARNSALRFGAVLIILGGLFLLARAAPDLFGPVGESSWPLIIVGVGILLLLIGAVTGAPGMAVPAAVVGGIGGLLYWQNATGNWQSWAYAWTLIPGFVGAGTLVAGLLEGKAQTVKGGLWLIVISLILFAIFNATRRLLRVDQTSAASARPAHPARGALAGLALYRPGRPTTSRSPI
jgi:hypothetical protein